MILVLITLLNVASNIVYLAAVTRDLFAFARDRGTTSRALLYDRGMHDKSADHVTMFLQVSPSLRGSARLMTSAISL